MLRNVVIFIILLFSSLCSAKEIQGKVIRVLDGDTIEISVISRKVSAYNVPVRIRLQDIDAPEKGQPFGRWSTNRLKEMVSGKPVTVMCKQKDRYGRVLGRVLTANGTDVNRYMVQVGAAWVYGQYNTDASLPTLQREAKQQKRGLWGDNNPIAPWKWRHN